VDRICGRETDEHRAVDPAPGRGRDLGELGLSVLHVVGRRHSAQQVDVRVQHAGDVDRDGQRPPGEAGTVERHDDRGRGWDASGQVCGRICRHDPLRRGTANRGGGRIRWLGMPGVAG
jgi:hypothetical protein